MKTILKNKLLLLSAGTLVVGAVIWLMMAGQIGAQSGWRLPVPCCLTTGSLMYARDANNFSPIDAVASGQVLTSAGVTTVPAWSASPTMTNLTVTTLTSSGDITANGNIVGDGSTALTTIGNADIDGTTTLGIVDQVTFAGIRSIQVTEDPALVATIVCAEQVLTTDATDLATGDIVIGPGVYVTGNALGMGAIHVSSTTEVTVTFCNPTAAGLTPSATDFTLFVIDAS